MPWRQKNPAVAPPVQLAALPNSQPADLQHQQQSSRRARSCVPFTASCCLESQILAGSMDTSESYRAGGRLSTSCVRFSRQKNLLEYTSDSWRHTFPSRPRSRISRRPRRQDRRSVNQVRERLKKRSSQAQERLSPRPTQSVEGGRAVGIGQADIGDAGSSSRRARVIAAAARTN